MSKRILTPAEIIVVLRPSSAKNPIEITLVEREGFKVIAAKNRYATGFCLHVVYNGNNYGVAGFERKPSEASFREALNRCIAYGDRCVNDPAFSGPAVAA